MQHLEKYCGSYVVPMTDIQKRRYKCKSKFLIVTPNYWGGSKKKIKKCIKKLINKLQFGEVSISNQEFYKTQLI